MQVQKKKIDGARKVGATIAAYTLKGERFVLNHRFPHRDHPSLGKTLRAVREAGEINLIHWRIARSGDF